jgi:hypothetical protein
VNMMDWIQADAHRSFWLEARSLPGRATMIAFCVQIEFKRFETPEDALGTDAEPRLRDAATPFERLSIGDEDQAEDAL